jgi:serine/threonine protein phosphatase PrpC
MNPNTQLNLRRAWKTDIGRNDRRRINEDFCNVTEWNDESGMSVLTALVADGMGGMEAGDVASQAAGAVWQSVPPPVDVERTEVQIDWTLELAWLANDAIIDSIGTGKGGCTLTGATFVGARFVLAHVGDSRAYLVTADRECVQITKDHSLVAALVANGSMTAEEALTSPDRNQILRSLGAIRDRRTDYIEQVPTNDVYGDQRFGELQPGESLLLMSDGVWGEIAPHDFRQIIRTHIEPHALCDALIDAALETGGSDNASIVVIQRPSEPSASEVLRSPEPVNTIHEAVRESMLQPPKRSPNNKGRLLGACALGVGALLGAGLLLNRQDARNATTAAGQPLAPQAARCEDVRYNGPTTNWVDGCDGFVSWQVRGTGPTNLVVLGSLPVAETSFDGTATFGERVYLRKNRSISDEAFLQSITALVVNLKPMGVVVVTSPNPSSDETKFVDRLRTTVASTGIPLTIAGEQTASVGTDPIGVQ